MNNLDPEPIVVSDSNYQFLYADPDEETVVIPQGQNIVISCPGGTLSVGSIEASTITATCESDNVFSSNNETFNFNDIQCSKKPFHTARYTGKSCESNGKEIEIGYELDEDDFVRQILICFDDINKNSLYSTYNLTKSIGNHEANVPRPSFIEDDFYNFEMTVNSLYVHGGQKATINNLLGLPENSSKYIQDSNDFFLARGHLTAKADFVYAPQQTATFHYVNVAPQWQTFNGGNWELVEADVRDYAETNGFDLKVYTGTYGITTLPHEETGEDIPLYLYNNEDEQALAVPELYWKAVYEPIAKKGIVLLGINNPYQQNVEKSIICEDVLSQVSWLTGKADDLEAGYLYACAVDDFREKVSYLPEFEVTDLLL